VRPEEPSKIHESHAIPEEPLWDFGDHDEPESDPIPTQLQKVEVPLPEKSMK